MNVALLVAFIAGLLVGGGGVFIWLVVLGEDEESGTD